MRRKPHLPVEWRRGCEWFELSTWLVVGECDREQGWRRSETDGNDCRCHSMLIIDQALEMQQPVLQTFSLCRLCSRHLCLLAQLLLSSLPPPHPSSPSLPSPPPPFYWTDPEQLRQLAAAVSPSLPGKLDAALQQPLPLPPTVQGAADAHGEVQQQQQFNPASVKVGTPVHATVHAEEEEQEGGSAQAAAQAGVTSGLNGGGRGSSNGSGSGNVSQSALEPAQHSSPFTVVKQSPYRAVKDSPAWQSQESVGVMARTPESGSEGDHRVGVERGSERRDVGIYSRQRGGSGKRVRWADADASTGEAGGHETQGLGVDGGSGFISDVRVIQVSSSDAVTASAIANIGGEARGGEVDQIEGWRASRNNNGTEDANAGYDDENEQEEEGEGEGEEDDEEGGGMRWSWQQGGSKTGDRRGGGHADEYDGYDDPFAQYC